MWDVWAWALSSTNPYICVCVYIYMCVCARGHFTSQQFLEQEVSVSLPGETLEGLQKDLSTAHHYSHIRGKYGIHGGNWDRCTTSTLWKCLGLHSKPTQAYIHLSSTTCCMPQGHLRCTSQYGLEHRLIHALWLDVKFEL